MMNVKIFGAQRYLAVLFVLLSACAGANPSGAADADDGPGDAFGPFLAAEYADARQDPGTAAFYYQQALRADPGNRILINNGFIASVLAGAPDAGRLAAQQPGNPLAVMLLGNQAAQAGNFAAAETLYAQLPDASLPGVLKPMLLAWAMAGKGDPNGALNTLIPQAANSPLGAVFILNGALIADDANDMKDATQLYQAADMAGEPPNLRLAQIMASWKARQGQTAAAEAELQQMVAAHPSLALALPAMRAEIAKPVIATPVDGLAEAYLTVAGALDQPQQVLLRVAFLRFALALRPDLSAARLLLATAQSGPPGKARVLPIQMRLALATLQPIQPSDPLYAPAVLQQADLLAALGQPDDAVALLEKLTTMMPNNLDALQEAGDILRSDGSFQRAIGYYGKAIAALPQPPPQSAWVLYYDRGVSSDQAGNWLAAQADLETALALSPNQPYVLNYLGYSWALRGENMARARQMLQQAVSLDPNEGAIIDSLGYVNLREGRTQTALKLLTQAVELDPDDAEVNAHLGDAFWAAGQRLQASYQWQRALGLGPDPKLQAEIQNKLKQIQPPA